MDLEGTYAVYLSGQKVGTASLSRTGLYFEVTSRCTPAGDEMRHLMMTAGKNIEDLGLMIPAHGALELKKKIPVKRIGEGEPSFFLRSRNSVPVDFVPVDPEAPFPYLQRLNSCAFAMQNGQAGVTFTHEK